MFTDRSRPFSVPWSCNHLVYWCHSHSSCGVPSSHGEVGTLLCFGDTGQGPGGQSGLQRVRTEARWLPASPSQEVADCLQEIPQPHTYRHPKSWVTTQSGKPLGQAPCCRADKLYPTVELLIAQETLSPQWNLFSTLTTRLGPALWHSQGVPC